jgi:hypothetical protein
MSMRSITGSGFQAIHSFAHFNQQLSSAKSSRGQRWTGSETSCRSVIAQTALIILTQALQSWPTQALIVMSYGVWIWELTAESRLSCRAQSRPPPIEPASIPSQLLGQRDHVLSGLHSLDRRSPTLQPLLPHSLCQQLPCC